MLLPMGSLPGQEHVIYPVLSDASYVLSSNFYNSTATMSLLEVLTWDYINGKSISPTVLVQLISNYAAWGGLERFYYLPIVLILIRSVVRNF
jgi:hypothetical protein